VYLGLLAQWLELERRGISPSKFELFAPLSPFPSEERCYNSSEIHIRCNYEPYEVAAVPGVSPVLAGWYLCGRER
jgi:hypothetical protein